MIQQIPTGSSKILGFKLTGKLHDADYRTFVPLLDAAIANEGKIRLLVHFEDFHGWDLHAAWDDFKVGVEYYADFERIAMVGEQAREKWMARICKPFTKATVKEFDHAADAALRW